MMVLSAGPGIAVAFVTWAVAAVLIVLFAVSLGSSVTRRWFGVLIDERGRVSLTHFQLALWTTVIMSLLVGVAAGRWWAGHSPFGISIPNDVLGLLAVSAGSAVTASAVKHSKDATAPDQVAAAGTQGYPPRLWQMFLVETGAFADQVVDIAKFQQFIITLVIAGAYVAEAIRSIHTANSAAALTSLPNLSGGFVVLLGISHAAYVGAKIPSGADAPVGTPTIASRSASLAQSTHGTGVGALWTAPGSANEVSVSWVSNPPTALDGADLAVTGPAPFTLQYAVDNAAPSQLPAAQTHTGSYSASVPAAQLLGAQTVKFNRVYPDGTSDATTTTLTIT
jgi:hypothetical protein